MRIAATISRYTLGILFTVFGLNGFLHFIPQPPPANPVALQFLTAVSVSHYMAVVFLVQLIAGILLLSGRYMTLAIALLAAVLVNILNYHITMDPRGIGLAAFAAVLWVILFVRYRSGFNGVFHVRAAESTGTSTT